MARRQTCEERRVQRQHEYDIHCGQKQSIRTAERSDRWPQSILTLQVMNTYLLVWNPIRWAWTSFERDIELLNTTGKCPESRWTCISRSADVGERFFLIKLGKDPKKVTGIKDAKGVMGAGYITSKSYKARHWSENREALYVDINFEPPLLNPYKEPILDLDILKTGKLAAQHWQPQASGISIRSELTDELESLWTDFTNERKRFL
jgi:5-methylcytosine-specific restriction protein A